MPQKLAPALLSWASDIEDGTAQQAARTSRLPFIDGHVALMPDAHIGIGATVGSVIPTHGAIIPAAVGVDIGCFRGDTRIPLLSGTQKSLKDMAEAGGNWWVYSLDSAGAIVPGKAVALKTRDDAELMRIVVSGGDEIVCTPDHQFMLNDGTYREARDLRFNESLMPLYRRWQTRDGYESVSTGKGASRQTHVLVHEAINGPVAPGEVVHHKNHIHFDNSPENLEALDAGEHSRYHRTVGHSFANSSAEFQARRLAGVRRGNTKPARRAQMAEVGSRNITAYMTGNPEHFRESVAGNGQRGAPVLTAFNTSPRPCDECEHVADNPAALRWHKSREHGHNHKVISAEHITERADVYCLQVEDHHNFALAAGVFVHNCGMVASETTLKAEDLPDTLAALMPLVERRIPAGVGKGHDDPATDAALADLRQPHTELTGKQANTVGCQFGTLGSGNHFVEVCLDERDRVWTVLHSGSRGIGNQLAKTHIDKARKLMKQWFIELEDPDLAYLVQGTPEFTAYIEDMLWCQRYAMASRAKMNEAIARSLFEVTGGGAVVRTVNCHHNFSAMEHHHGHDMWVTRKGAIKAASGEHGIIPGSMGTSTFIVTGLGSAASYDSCSHGAGRRMSRGDARRKLTAESLTAAMGDRTWNADRAASLVDEHPEAYKDVEQVMRDQADLATIEHTLRQVFNYKG
jgi:tRNA-splicing ligase RtcB